MPSLLSCVDYVVLNVLMALHYSTLLIKFVEPYAQRH